MTRGLLACGRGAAPAPAPALALARELPFAWWLTLRRGTRPTGLVAGLGVLATVLGSVPGQDRTPAAVADASADLAPIRAEFDVPALGAGAIRDGALLALGAVGKRQRGGDQPVTTEDLWHLGSCTKAMTATLLAVLAQRGKLDFDASLPDLLPAASFPMHETWTSVTLEQLLRHRAGLDRDFPPPVWRAMRTEPDQADARTAAVRSLLAQAPPHAPGTRMVYANAGYVIAGVVAEAKAEQSWEAAMRALVFAPLGITTAGFGAPGEGAPNTQPWGHGGSGERRPVPPGAAADNPAAMGPAGTVHMSMRDWARFIALHAGGDGGSPALLDAQWLARLHDQGDGDYACGWVVTERGWAPGEVITHSGSNTLWYATVWAAPQRRVAMFAVCNQGGDAAARACDRAVAAMLARLDRTEPERPGGK